MTRVDITIAYLSLDERFARALVDILTQCGLSVGEYQVDTADDAQLSQAEKVAIVWSHKSANYRNTRASAATAQERGALIIIKSDDSPVPERFASSIMIAMRDWSGEREHHGFQSLLALLPVPTKLGNGRTRNGYPMLEEHESVSVFIAHATPDKPRLRPLIIELLDAGFSVWIDSPGELALEPHYYERMKSSRIQASADWQGDIKRALDTRDWVLAIWSPIAFQGEPRERRDFHYEMFLALQQNKFVPCFIERVDAGLPYSFVQAVDLSQLKPGQHDMALEQLIEKLASR